MVNRRTAEQPRDEALLRRSPRKLSGQRATTSAAEVQTPVQRALPAFNPAPILTPSTRAQATPCATDRAPLLSPPSPMAAYPRISLGLQILLPGMRRVLRIKRGSEKRARLNYNHQHPLQNTPKNPATSGLDVSRISRSIYTPTITDLKEIKAIFQGILELVKKDTNIIADYRLTPRAWKSLADKLQADYRFRRWEVLRDLYEHDNEVFIRMRMLARRLSFWFEHGDNKMKAYPSTKWAELKNEDHDNGTDFAELQGKRLPQYALLERIRDAFDVYYKKKPPNSPDVGDASSSEHDIEVIEQNEAEDAELDDQLYAKSHASAINSRPSHQSPPLAPASVSNEDPLSSNGLIWGFNADQRHQVFQQLVHHARKPTKSVVPNNRKAGAGIPHCFSMRVWDEVIQGFPSQTVGRLVKLFMHFNDEYHEILARGRDFEGIEFELS